MSPNEQMSSAKWVVERFPFLCGLAPLAVLRRALMPIQVFIDDSGGRNQGTHFVLAGLAGDAESWVEFSEEWELCLGASPCLTRLKMKEAAGLSGEFYGWSVEQRDEKLKALASIINRHPRLAVWSVLELSAYEGLWRPNLPKPMNEHYFWPFQTVIMAACFDLWEMGIRSRFEIIFDEQRVFGPRAKEYYPVTREIMEKVHPEPASILPIEPIFRDDSEFLPLQAADLFAWCIRHNTTNPDNQKFEWLIDEMPNVRDSEHSCYYDRDRAESVMQLATALKPFVEAADFND